MQKKKTNASINRVDVQVSIFTAIIVILSCFIVFLFHYRLTYRDMITSLEKRTVAIHEHIATFLNDETFNSLNSPVDMDTELYRSCQSKMYSAKQAAGVKYLYTAKKTEDGSFVYVVDGISWANSNFHRPGDPIEAAIVPELNRALSGEVVLPYGIKDTDWGKIFITYLPVYDGAEIIGVVGIEFEAEHQYNTYRLLRISTPIITIAACIIAAYFAVFLFKRISNPTFRDLYNTDYLTQLKNRNAFETDMNNLRVQKLMDGKAVLVLDLNNLKVVNDTYGHESGDWYLETLGRIINDSIPSQAAAYRVGGDEFAIVVPAEKQDELIGLCNMIKSKLAKSCPENWKIDLTCAMGYAMYDTDKEVDIYETYCRADKAMYVNKEYYHSLRSSASV